MPVNVELSHKLGEKDVLEIVRDFQSKDCQEVFAFDSPAVVINFPQRARCGRTDSELVCQSC